VRLEAGVMADGERGSVDDAEAGAGAHRRVQGGHPRQVDGRQERADARRAAPLGDCGAPMRWWDVRGWRRPGRGATAIGREVGLAGVEARAYSQVQIAPR
jgi:hypothetical protein